MDDIGVLLFGKTGKLLFSVGLVLCELRHNRRAAVGLMLDLLIACGLGVSSISTALNGVSAHATCTAVFMAIAAVVTFLLSSIQTMGKLWYLGAAGSVSIFLAGRCFGL